MATTTFQDAFEYADAAVSKYVTDGATAAAESIQELSHILLVMYVMLWGWSMIRGLVNEPVTDGVARILKIAIITGLATNSALYSSYVADFLYDWPPAFAGVMSGAGEAINTAELIDNILEKGLDLAGQAWENASLANIGNYILGAVIFLSTYTVTAIAAVIIISAKLGLSMLLAIGPLFILTLLFGATRNYFDRWVGMSITAGITIVLVSMAAALTFKLLGSAFDVAQSEAAANGGVVSIKAITPVVVYGIITVFYLIGTPMIAAGIGGGVSTASAAAAGWAYDKIMNTSKLGFKASKAAYRFIRGSEGGFGRSRSNGGGSIQKQQPQAVYRRITNGRRYSKA